MSETPFDQQKWSELLEDWQSQPVKPVDTTALLVKIKRRSWFIWLASIADVVGVALLTIMGIYGWFFAGDKKEESLLLMLLSVWGMVMIFYEFKLRRGTWRLKDQGNESVLCFSIRRCEVAISVGRLCVPAIGSCASLLLAWQALVYYCLSGELFTVFVLSGLAWLLLVLFASKWFVARKRKELAKLKALL